MRSDEEILERIEESLDEDWFCTTRPDLVCRLPYEKAKPYLRDEVTPESWTVLSRDRDSLIEQMKSYMPFAWDKVKNQRPMSALRSLQHYKSWLWLAGDDLGDLYEIGGFQDYGAEALRKICAHYGWDWREFFDAGYKEE